MLDGDAVGVAVTPLLMYTVTVEPDVSMAPAPGDVYATLPRGTLDATEKGETSTTNPTRSNRLTASVWIIPLTVGTSTSSPSISAGLIGVNFDGATPSRAPSMACCQMGPGIERP